MSQRRHTLAKGKRKPPRPGGPSVPAQARPTPAKAQSPQVAPSKDVQHQRPADNAVLSKAAAGNPPPPATPEASSRVAPGGPASRVHAWWSNATKWTKAIFAILVGLATIIVAIPVILNAVRPPRTVVLSQAAADAKKLNSLRAGELFSAFQHSLKESPTVNVWGRAARIKRDVGSTLISDYLFVLRTVYVEAFVGSNNTVDAYTITARTSDMPQGISILGHNYDLGKMTLANAPLDGITLVADVCAIQIGAYYEISGTDETHLLQTVAVGITGAGSVPRGYQFPACPYGSTDSLAQAAGAPGFNSQTGLYRIVERFTNQAYLARSESLRKKMLINTITITAPGYPVAPEMISLHPQEVAPYAPK